MKKSTFLIVGKHEVQEALKNPYRKVERVFVTEDAQKKLNRENQSLNLFKKTNQQKVIGINIYSEKNKTIKEKNIKNEITKYQLNVKIKIEVLNQNGNKIKEFTINENGEYLVYKQYSKTLNNEKKLSETLTKKVIDQILDNLINYSNEF